MDIATILKIVVAIVGMIPAVADEIHAANAIINSAGPDGKLSDDQWIQVHASLSASLSRAHKLANA